MKRTGSMQWSRTAIACLVTDRRSYCLHDSLLSYGYTLGVALAGCLLSGTRAGRATIVLIDRS